MNVALIVIGGVVGSLALVGAIIYVVHKYEKARSEQLQAVADELGLQFHPQGDAAVQDAIGHLQLFNRGHARKTQNMIFGQSDEIEIAIFGYRYTTGGGKNQQTHQQTVISFQSPHLSLPEFELRPEHFFHKTRDRAGLGAAAFPRVARKIAALFCCQAWIAERYKLLREKQVN